jgi:hypothetical protein
VRADQEVREGTRETEGRRGEIWGVWRRGASADCVYADCGDKVQQAQRQTETEKQRGIFWETGRSRLSEAGQPCRMQWNARANWEELRNNWRRRLEPCSSCISPSQQSRCVEVAALCRKPGDALARADQPHLSENV